MATIPKRSRQNPWEISSLDVFSINEVLRQIQLSVDNLQVTEHKHTGTERSGAAPQQTGEVLQIVETSINPPELVSNQRDYNPSGLVDATIIRVSAAVPVHISGLAAQPEGTIKKFFNYGSNPITLKNQSHNSRSVNRFNLTADIIMGTDQTVTVQYDATTNYPRWKVIGNAGGSSAGVITDHGGLTGLLDDDHPQYLLASDATSRAVFAADWIDLTDGGATTLHTHAGGSTHTILDASAHSDTVLQGVSRGSLIYGNATPKWDELVIGASGKVLTSDGTDVSWQTPSSGAGSAWSVLTNGDPDNPEIAFDSFGDVVMVETLR